MAVARGRSASEAYREAYPSSLAWVQSAVWNAGHKMMAIVEVSERVAQLQQAITDSAIVEQVELIRELAHMLRADPADAYDKEGRIKSIHDIPRDLRRCIAAVKTRRIETRGDENNASRVEEYVTELKLWDKQGTIDKLMKHLGAYAKDNEQKPPDVMPVVNIIIGTPHVGVTIDS